MEVREYLAIRRAYNTIRQRCDADKRLTFSEFAIACRLSLSPEGLRTSDIAEYQGCLRPTMTHRTKHLADFPYPGRERPSVVQNFSRARERKRERGAPFRRR